MSKLATAFFNWQQGYSLTAAIDRKNDWEVDEFAACFPKSIENEFHSHIRTIGSNTISRAEWDYTRMIGRENYRKHKKEAEKLEGLLNRFANVLERDGYTPYHDIRKMKEVQSQLGYMPGENFESIIQEARYLANRLDFFISEVAHIRSGTNSDRLAWWFAVLTRDFWTEHAIPMSSSGINMRNRFALAAWSDLRFPAPKSVKSGNELDWMQERFDALPELATQNRVASSPPG